MSAMSDTHYTVKVGIFELSGVCGSDLYEAIDVFVPDCLSSNKMVTITIIAEDLDWSR